MPLGLSSADISSMQQNGTATAARAARSLGATPSLPPMMSFRTEAPGPAATAAETVIPTVMAGTVPGPGTTVASTVDTSRSAKTDTDLGYRLSVYRVELGIYFQGSDEMIDLSESVVGMNLISNFDDHLIPFFEFELLLGKGTYSDVMKFYREARAVIKITRHTSSQGAQPGIGEAFLPATPCTIVDVEGQPVDGLPSPESDLNKTIPLTLYLFTQAHLRATKTVMNRVFEGVAVGTVAGHLVSSNTDFKVLMVEPHNTKVYEQIIIPPFTIRKAMEFLQAKYGIYRDGLRFFYGFRNVHVMGRTDSVWNEDDSGDVVVEVVDMANNQQFDSDGHYFDGSVHRIRTSARATVNPSSVASGELDGEKLMVGSANQSAHSSQACESALKGDETSNDPESPKERAYWNASSNEYAASEFVARNREAADAVTLQMTGVDVTALAPEKRYRIKFTADALKKFEGTYRVASCGHRFIRKSGDAHAAVVSVAKFLVVSKDAVGRDGSVPA